MTTRVLFLNDVAGAFGTDAALPEPAKPATSSALGSFGDSSRDFPLSVRPATRGAHEHVALGAFLRDFPKSPRAWIGRFQRELSRFGALAGNPDGPGKEAIAAASDFLELLWQRQDHLAPSRIAPSVDGGIVVSFFRDRVRANVEFFDSGEVAAAIAEIGGEPCVWQVQNDEEGLGDAIGAIAERIAPGSSRSNVSPRTAEG